MTIEQITRKTDENIFNNFVEFKENIYLFIYLFIKTNKQIRTSRLPYFKKNQDSETSS